MYLTVRWLAMSGAFVEAAIRTLVVHDSSHNERQEELPHIETGEDSGKEAIGVELLDHVGDFRVRSRRDKTRIHRHVEVCEEVRARRWES
jgi:hypothetical protein